jgi:ABC-type transport system substrate-binding protein
MWRDYSDNAFISRGMKPSACLGSGPFVYNASANTYYRFTAAPNYHGATDYGAERTIKIHNILYTVFGDPQALTLAMNSGEVDTIVLTGQPNLYLNTLGKDASVNVIKQTVQEMGICDIAINGIPELKNGNLQQWRERNYATGNGLLQDVMVRKALAMTLNKQSIKDDIYKGLVRIADSVVQPGYWHKTPDNQVSYDPAAAKLMLEALGYQDTDTDGTLEATSGSRAVVEGWASVGDELSFRLHAPTNEPSYMAIAQNWVQWAALAGIKLNYRALSESFMTNADWFMSDYDIWVWHWGWSPEPLGAILSTWMTDQMKVGGDNCQGPMGPWWYGPDNATASPTGTQYSSFDQNWTNALRTVDTAARKVLVDRLQQQLYDSYTEIPPFYDVGLYGYTDERFMGWGDWETHIGRSTYATYLWLWYDLEPLGNAKPVFDSPLNPSYTVLVNTPQTFQVVVYDAELTDTVTVNWSFGDGSPIERVTVGTGVTTPTTVSRTHTYAVLSPVYGYNLSAALWDGQPGHEKLSKAVVYVVSSPDTGPSIGAVSAVPASPQYNDTVITWSVSARDHESGGPGAKNYGLLFTWNWGDGTYTVTRYHPTVNDVNVIDTHTHSWSSMGVYNVRVNVWDGFGLQTDPVHNASSGVISYEIIENTPPDVPTISPISGTAGTWVTCLASSADLDPDTLRFTWDWGGTYNVTNHAVSVPLGSQVTSTVMHNWATAGTYPVTVYVDDLTNIAGHNISLSENAIISAVGVNVAPTALLVSATPSTAYNDAVVTLDASAIDTDGDPLSFYITYGDDGTGVASTAGGSAARQYVTPAFTHSYATASVYTVTIHVNDGQGHNVSTTTTVTIIENQPPTLTIQTTLSARYNATFSMEPTQVADTDGDTVTVWYDWGDDSAMTAGDPLNAYAASHVYHVTEVLTVTVWADDGTGLAGHNVSQSADITISQNLIPQFRGAVTKTPSKVAYNQSESITFAFTVWDYEGDNLTLVIQWGDGAVTTETHKPAADTNYTWNVSHAYAVGNTDPYVLTATLKDDMDHYQQTWQIAHSNVQVNKPSAPTEPKGGTNWALIGGIGAIIIVALVIIAVLLMKRKKGGEKAEETAGGMEGMAPPPP